MTEDRPGEGKTTSRTGAKEGLGRSFITANHEGRKANQTEILASQRLERGLPKDRPLTTNEIEDFRSLNKALFDSLKSANPDEIREAFKLYN